MFNKYKRKIEELKAEIKRLEDLLERTPSEAEYSILKDFYDGFTEEEVQIKESLAKYICYLLQVPDEGKKSHKDISRIKVLIECYRGITDKLQYGWRPKNY